MQTKNVVPMLSAEGYRRRQRAFAEQPAKPTTYYGRPMLKKPTWKWFIPLYLFLGGVAGGVALLGALAEMLGGPRHRATVRHARYLSLLLSILCPVLLILDLGRLVRFHHMLRVFKLSSPLSVGTWILSTFVFRRAGRAFCPHRSGQNLGGRPAGLSRDDQGPARRGAPHALAAGGWRACHACQKAAGRGDGYIEARFCAVLLLTLDRCHQEKHRAARFVLPFGVPVEQFLRWLRFAKLR